MKYLVGLILIVLGGIIIRYRYHIYGFTGDWGWAQKYLGGNGTITAISLIGCFLIFAGVAYPFGAFDFGRGNGPIAPQFGSANTK